MATTQIDAEVAAILGQATADGCNLQLPPEQLERGLYVKVNKVIEALGGTWDRKLKAHVFVDPVADLLAEALGQGRVVDLKQQWQFFETPRAVAERLCDLADLTPGETVLEPSAGRGALADVLSERGALVLCVELNPRNAQCLRDKGYEVSEEDFLTMPATADYATIIANPPFTKQQDIDHVNHMLDCLGTPGVCVSVMSAGTRFRENAKATAFRGRIVSFGGEFFDLPDGAFKDSGTNANACVVRVVT